MKYVKFVICLLVIVGALNWGLVGFFQYDLVASIFGGMHTMAARVVYSLVGIAGLLSIKCLFKGSGCSGGGCNCGPGCGCGCGSKR